MIKHFLAGLLTTFIAVAPVSGALAQVDYTDPKQRNPQNDPDVERGYQEHQEKHKQKQEEQQSESDNPNYEVDSGEQESTYKTQ